MRWIKSEKIRYMEGDKRERGAFLWLPLSIGQEVRWLEFAQWKERYSFFGYWRPAEWMS